MNTRREFLGRSMSMLLLIPIASSCSSSSTPAIDAATCVGDDSTSSLNEDHTHTVCVPTTDLTNPPAAGATYTTSNDSQHTHTIMLTQAQLTMIQAGTAVMVTSSSNVDPTDGVAHTHTFNIMNA